MPAIVHVSKNFTLAEYACRCGCTYHTLPHVRAAVERHATVVMQPIRDKAGCPLHITSGVRCPRWNEHVDGAPASKHMAINGVAAADFIPDGKSLIVVHRIALTVPGVGGCHRYRTFIHADDRPRINGAIQNWED